MKKGLLKLAASQNPQFLAGLKGGTLHRELGISKEQKIPVGLLQSLKAAPVGTHVNVGGKKVAVTEKLQKKVNFALNARKWEH